MSTKMVSGKECCRLAATGVFAGIGRKLRAGETHSDDVLVFAIIFNILLAEMVLAFLKCDKI